MVDGGPVMRRARALSPGHGVVVMAGGVLSLCFLTASPSWLSWALFAVSAVVWIALVAGLGLRMLTDSRRLLAEAQAPSALTMVAGTAVLGDWATGTGRWRAAEGLLLLALVLWLALLKRSLTRRPLPATGTSFLLCVAPQSLAVLTAQLARGTGQAWEVYAAAVAFVIGLVLYGVVLRRFDVGQVLAGEGDQWVLGGALAISAVAGTTMLDAATRLGVPHAMSVTLRVLTPCLAVAAAVAYVPLAVAEAARPRLRYDLRRWSTVFPLGMAGLLGLRMSAVFHRSALRDAGHVISWVALVVWLAVLAGTLRRAWAGAGSRMTRRSDGESP